MTGDPAGVEGFYDAVVGLDDRRRAVGDDGLPHDRHRSDGGIVGGVLRLTEEMQEHGARPCWLGYIGVHDVDAAVAGVEARRRQGADAGPRHSQASGASPWSTDPEGAPFYVMTPTARSA